MFNLSSQLVDIAKAKKIKIATAESCTGGIVGAAITSIAGSSEVYDRGFVTYSYESKTEQLGVDPAIISGLGAVSQEVAEQMAIGAYKNSNAQITIAITGIAGPTGSTANKPVGLVHFAICLNGEVKAFSKKFSGDRDDIRKNASIFALEKMIECLTN